MTGATLLTITEESIYQAAESARQCSSAVVRERVLVSQTVALTIREKLRELFNIETIDGHSGSTKYVELLDICDFVAKDWHIEVRVITEADEPALYVPTMPILVGILSDLYISVQVDRALSSAGILGYAARADLAEADLCENGLFAVLPIENLRSFESMPQSLKERRPYDPEQANIFEEWQARAERIISKMHEIFKDENIFEIDHINRLAGGLRDDILRIYDKRLPETQIEPLFELLFKRFSIEQPVPSIPGNPVAFNNRMEDSSKFKSESMRDRYFRDDLSVGERVAFYRYLLEENAALEEHRKMKRFLDKATGGKRFVSPRRRTYYRSVNEKRAKAEWREPKAGYEGGEEFFPDMEESIAGSIEQEEIIMSKRPVHFEYGKKSLMPVSQLENVVTLAPDHAPEIDFSTNSEIVRVVAEGERLTYGHLFNPAFATEISLIDPLPHQRIAVYEHMLKQTRLRFLLADDAGAGKTIMAGLYIREMLARRLIQRVLIVPPAGLVGNWEREMRTLFTLPFRIASGTEAKSNNPFIGPDSNFLIVSIDTLAGHRMFSRLQEPSVVPYDLVIFDEAHKLSADREPDFTIRRTDRYRLGEALAGIQSEEPEWQLDWSPNNFLLLTATPHMGKDIPYYYLWRLLEPSVLSTYEAFNSYPVDARKRHFIRRTKEEMIRFDESRIYPTRISDTLSYDLTQGKISEQELYNKTTDYIQSFYNLANMLNRSAVRLVMSIFQRRLASSTYALMRSFERRLEKLDWLISAVKSGQLDEKLSDAQRKLEKIHDVLYEKTADEEEIEGDKEENENVESQALAGVVVLELAKLQAERMQVESLLKLAQRVYDLGDESKFEKLQEILQNSKYKDEKIIIFTEHRDTLDFLVRRLEGLGFTGQVARIHGGMDYREREENVEFFRKPASEGGATYLVATDAAGEGINLQFCWLMVNYDIPWNPARLEQRMGRIHRYKQNHDPVIILNLIAGKTREGRVLKTLLDKLERIRKELKSDKVFDVVGRLFEGVSLKQYMEHAVTEKGAAEATQLIEGKLTKEQIGALQESERRLFGDGGDVKKHLAALKESIEVEELRRILPGYVRRFIEKGAPLLDIGIEGDLEKTFSFRALKPTALDPLWPILENYLPEQRSHLTVYRPADLKKAIFLHPGEQLFDHLRGYICSRFGQDALRGGVFIDPNTEQPYLFHLALISVLRKADPSIRHFTHNEILECRLVGLKQMESGQVEECPIEYLLLLKGSQSIPSNVSYFAASAPRLREIAKNYTIENIAKSVVEQKRQALVEALPERENFIKRGYDFQEAELLAKRTKLRDKSNNGNAAAKAELTKIKDRQHRLLERREEVLSPLRREPELIVPDEIIFLAHALVVPSSDPEDRKRHDEAVETMAVKVAWDYEIASGATVKDVSTPERSIAAGLTKHPGFDLLSIHPGRKERAIEVKGRAGVGDVELTENEWVKACNLRERYWLYVVFDCASSRPRLLRIQDPFGKLIVRAKGTVIINEQELFLAAEGN